MTYIIGVLTAGVGVGVAQPHSQLPGTLSFPTPSWDFPYVEMSRADDWSQNPGSPSLRGGGMLDVPEAT